MSLERIDQKHAELTENSIFAKLEVMREGSSLRNAEELKATFVYDVCEILNIATPNDELNELASMSWNDDDENAYQNLADYVSNAEEKLAEAGYTVVWDDGFCIYKDLTDEEADYLLP